MDNRKPGRDFGTYLKVLVHDGRDVLKQQEREHYSVNTTRQFY